MTGVRTIDGTSAVEDYGYWPAPAGVRANMIFSADGAAAFQGRAGPLSSPADQQLLLALRAYADVVLVGAGTARAENYGPVSLRPEHRAQRRELGLRDEPPPIAVVSQSGRLPARIFDSPTPPILITSARSAKEIPREKPCRTWWPAMTMSSCRTQCGDSVSREWNAFCAKAVPRCSTNWWRPTSRRRTLRDAGSAEAGCQPLGRGTPAGNPTPTVLRLSQVLVAADDYLYLRYGRR